ncbi:MAG: hypothetical protein HYZ57_01215 [Acidobacteria bacterium]|nr:hypothetical protein [Acidobacteriota bacterium]
MTGIDVSPITGVWKLPPLILHPFSDRSSPQKLMESSRANLILQGLLPGDELNREDLDRTLIEGRYCEVRMLYYVGKDICRWIEQCLEFAARDRVLCSQNIQFQSFASLLVDDPPGPVRDKLNRWGVADYKSIFSRAIGLNSLFAEAPGRDQLSDCFLRHYYRFADQLYRCRQTLAAFTAVGSANFDFELYASGEYSRMLEQQWA